MSKNKSFKDSIKDIQWTYAKKRTNIQEQYESSRKPGYPNPWSKEKRDAILDALDAKEDLLIQNKLLEVQPIFKV